MVLKKFHKKIRNASLMLLGIILVTAIIVQLLAKQYVTDILKEKIPDKLKLDYTNLHVNILTGNVQIENVSLNYSETDSALYYSRVRANKLRMEGFSLWQYFVNNTVDIDGIFLDNPNAIHYACQMTSEKDSVSRSANTSFKSVTIGVIKIHNGSIGLMWQKPDSTKLAAHTIDLSLTNIKIDPNTLKNGIPITYDAIALSANNIFVDMGPYERLKVKNLKLEDHVLKTHNLTIQSKYGKHELSGILKKERDHIDMDIPEIVLDSFDFGIKDGRYFVFADHGRIEHPNLEIYRDKLVADDLEEKRLYGNMLRELPMDLTIYELEIRQGQLGYEELVNAGTGPGRIFFDQISTKMQNISNTYSDNEKTRIQANAIFMENAPMSLDWSFDVNNENDTFLASGTFRDFEAESINLFLESNMRSQAKGRADEIYFTVSGNAKGSTGDMKMKYSNFEFVILKKNRSGINKLLTAVSNVFVSKGSKSEENGYRYGKIEAERDPTKSFFNYLWINVRNGLGSTLTGDGEKK